jgi:hypothetical protein
VNNFKTLAYAKLNLDFDREVFSREYDEHIFPGAHNVCNSIQSQETSADLNKTWGMVDPEVYNTCDVFYQPGDNSTYRYIKRQREQWRMFTLTELDENCGAEERLIKASKRGGNGVRNLTLGMKSNIKSQFENLEIVKWIKSNLPLKTIQWIHCVSIEPGGFASIHRDMKGFFSSKPTAGKNLLYNEGYVVICLNISNGGSPLYWALDGQAITDCYKSDEKVYISNDYFVHGVGVCTERRRQIRVSGIPTEELWNIIDKESVIDIGENYQYVPFFGSEK